MDSLLWSDLYQDMIYLHVGETLDYNFESLSVDLTSGYTIEFIGVDGWSVTGNSEGIMNLKVTDTSNITWGQKEYKVKLTDPSGNVSFPFYGIIWTKKR